MTLDEAIKHAEEVAKRKESDLKVYEGINEDRPLFLKEENECKKCAEEHRQLAEWLRELKAVREAWSQLVETVIEIKDNAVDDKDSDSNARHMARFFFNYLRVLEEGIMKEAEGCRTVVGALSRD